MPKGTSVVLLGQVQTMDSAFSGLLFGLLGAIVLIYLLIVVNFQSWLDPFVIITALPAALAGIVWMLFATQHHAVGAGADRRDHVHGRGHRQQHAGGQLRARAARRSSAMPSQAALEAGFVRFRPVLMTALAMIIGMVPMALGLGEGGEQNAPLGRAVIGGLVFATVATLFFVPVVFSLVHARRQAPAAPVPPFLENSHASLILLAAPPRRAPAAAQASSPVAVVAALVVVVAGIATRCADAQRAARARRDAQAVPTVAVVTPRRRRRRSRALDLPGRLEAFARAPIYARVSGYLKTLERRHRRAGEGRAAAGRDRDAGPRPAAAAGAGRSRHRRGQRRAGRGHRQALAGAARQRLGVAPGGRREDRRPRRQAGRWSSALQANVERYQALKRFKRIVAPFDGVVTARNTDVGALINAGGAPGPELFVVSDTEQAARLRERAAEPGRRCCGRAAQATLTVPERPGKPYAATVQSMSQAISSRPPAACWCSCRSTTRRSNCCPGGFANVQLRHAARRGHAEHPAQRADLRQGRPAGRDASGRTTRWC